MKKKCTKEETSNVACRKAWSVMIRETQISEDLIQENYTITYNQLEEH